MPAITPEQLGRRIKWYRDRRKLTQGDLATRLGFNDRQTLSDIEAGKRKISPAELVVLTEALHVDLDDLVDPFRLVGEGGFNFRVSDVDTDTIAAFEDEASRWIATYRELGRQAGDPPSVLGHKLELTQHSSFEDAAAKGEALVKKWNLGETPALTLEATLARELGTLVLYVDAPNGVSGAASHLPGLQTILVNRNEVPGRRSFDLAHELFHILTWDAMPPERIEGREPKTTKGNRVERLADNFAAALLIPESALRTRWNERGNADLRDWLTETAQVFRVTPITLQWRLVNLDLLKQSATVDVTGAGADPFAPRPQLFSEPFVARVHAGVEAGRLSLRRAASLLGVSILGFADLCRSYGLQLSYDV